MFGLDKIQLEKLIFEQNRKEELSRVHEEFLNTER